MKPSAAIKATGRLAVSLGLAAALSAPAWAGDRALFNAIGYAAKGNYFAFEEFGISDGAGIAYDTLYIVDLQKDSWVIGTPIHVQGIDENETVGAVRAKVLAKAAPQLNDLGIDTPADLFAHIGDGVADNDGSTLKFGLPSDLRPGAVDGAYTLKLSTFAATATAPCEQWFGEPPLGYKLVIAGDGADRQIHADDSLPRSRGCPQAYRLYGVLNPIGAMDLSAGVAIISAYPHGFEGPDRRFLAVPITAVAQ